MVGIYFFSFDKTNTEIQNQVTGPFDAEIIALLPPSAKFICHVGAGYDNIDVEACTKRGKIVLNLLKRQWNKTHIDLKEFPSPIRPISTFTL